VLGKSLDPEIMRSVVNGPTKEYETHYHETNSALADLQKKIMAYLEKEGVSALRIPPTLTDEDIDDPKKYLENLTYDFSHKMAATRAGLGWIGKTAILVTKKYGPRLRLATILINRSLENPGKPIEKGRCGKCVECVEKCPAQAANGKHWNINVHRDEFFDAFKCREKCRELSRNNMQSDISLCGICLAVCPIGMTG
jgi:epoxyqueuosine reductase QueG